MNIQSVQNDESQEFGTPIVIKKEMTTKELHDRLEEYMAAERLKGVKHLNTKPKAALHIIKEKLGLR